jgi:enoyl-[acyl-carrier-protein] reductase (NADH)
MGQYDLNYTFNPRQAAELNAPMVCGVTQEEVGRTALFLLSDLFSGHFSA